VVSVVDVVLVASTVISHVVVVFVVNVSQFLRDCFNTPAHSSHLLLKLVSTNQISCVVSDCLPSVIAAGFKPHR
jgi:hypothetical protein